MKKSVYKKNGIFSPPNFLKSYSFGLDITDNSIKFAKLILTKKGIKVDKYGQKIIPKGIIESGRIIDRPKLEKILIELRDQNKIKDARISIVENQTYLFKLILEKENLKNIKESIEFVLEEHIPIKASDTVFDYEIIEEKEDEILIQVIAIQKEVVGAYLSIFQKLNINIFSFEPEAQAISRAVLKKNDLYTYMIIDIGKERTTLFIVSKGVLIFTSTIDFSGNTLNRMLQEHLNVSAEEAENIKIKYGLQRNIEDKEIFPILLNGVSLLRDEILKHFFYWHSHEDEFGNKNPQIDKILFCGGNSNIINIIDYFSITMKIKVEIGDIWTNIQDVNKDLPEIDLKETLSFITAFGLALGNFEYD